MLAAGQPGRDYVNRHRPPESVPPFSLSSVPWSLGWGGRRLGGVGPGAKRHRADSVPRWCAIDPRYSVQRSGNSAGRIPLKSTQRAWVGRPTTTWRSWWRNGLKADRQDAARKPRFRREGFNGGVGSMRIHRLCCGLERRREPTMSLNRLPNLDRKQERPQNLLWAGHRGMAGSGICRPLLPGSTACLEPGRARRACTCF